MSIKQRLVLNGVATVIQKLVLFGQHLLLVPVFLTVWGVGYYGEWLTLTAIPAAFALSDLGLATAVANAFVISYASGNTGFAFDLLKTGYVVVAVLMAVFALIGSVGLLCAKCWQWAAGLEMPENVAIGVVGLMSLSRLVCFYAPLNDSMFRAAGKTHVAINLATVFAICRLFVGAFCLWFGASALVFAAGDLLVSFIAISVSYRIGRMALPGSLGGRVIVDWAVMRPLVLKSIAYAVAPVRRGISIQGTTVAVRVSLGAEAVALFVTLRTIVNSISQFLSSVNATVSPELQLAIARQDLSLATRLYVGAVRTGVLSAMVFAFAVYFLGPSVYMFWTKGQLGLDRGLLAVLLVSVVVNSAWWTASMVFRAANKPEGFAIAGIVFAVVGVYFSWSLCGRIGIVGAALGLLVMECGMAAYAIPASCWLIRLPPYRFLVGSK